MNILRRGTQLVMTLAVVQVYLAALGVFGSASYDAHAVTGWVTILVGWVLVGIAAVAGRGAGRVKLALGIALLLTLQPVLAFVPRARFPAVSALHAPNALLIIALAYVLARRARTATAPERS